MDIEKLNDLDTILNVKEESNTKINSEASISLDNVTLLDEEKNEPEINLRLPEVILSEYSDYDLKNEELDAKIEEIKAKNKEVFDSILELEKLKEVNSEVQSKLKDELKDSMAQYEKKNIKNDFWSVTYVAAYKKTTFDRKGFEKKYPVLAKQFINESDVAASTRWTRAK